jgi:CubicO group peptidase (beta-lactamase class C family)
MAVLLLFEAGHFALDDPIERFIPKLGNRRVLRRDPSSIDDTDPAAEPITIRHLLTHTSGLSYGLFDPGTVLYKAYQARKVLSPMNTLEAMTDVIADLPLSFHPGTAWQYSVATDVLARLVEVVSGQAFDAFIKARVLDPLGMVDTGFVVPQANRDRFVAYYAGANLLNPMEPGLTRTDDAPYPQAYLRPAPNLSGGGGLVSTLPDMLALVRSLLPDGPSLLKPETLSLMMSNQLPAGMSIAFAGLGPVPGKGFGLGGSVTIAPSAIDPPDSLGEFQWGGVAGTHWWISPRHKLAGVMMAQRQMAFWHPYSFEFKKRVFHAMGV